MSRRMTALGVVASVVVALVLALSGVAVIRFVGERATKDAAAERVRLLILDCIRPGPNPPPHTGHECFDLAVELRARERASQQLSIDCAALFVLGHEPAPCVDVLRRLHTLTAGQLPPELAILTTTTTTIPGGR